MHLKKGLLKGWKIKGITCICRWNLDFSRIWVILWWLRIVTHLPFIHFLLKRIDYLMFTILKFTFIFLIFNTFRNINVRIPKKWWMNHVKQTCCSLCQKGRNVRSSNCQITWLIWMDLSFFFFLLAQCIRRAYDLLLNAKLVLILSHHCI